MGFPDPLVVVVAVTVAMRRGLRAGAAGVSRTGARRVCTVDTDSGSPNTILTARSSSGKLRADSDRAANSPIRSLALGMAPASSVVSSPVPCVAGGEGSAGFVALRATIKFECHDKNVMT